MKNEHDQGRFGIGGSNNKAEAKRVSDEASDDDRVEGANVQKRSRLVHKFCGEKQINGEHIEVGEQGFQESTFWYKKKQDVFVKQSTAGKEEAEPQTGAYGKTGKGRKNRITSNVHDRYSGGNEKGWAQAINTTGRGHGDRQRR